MEENTPTVAEQIKNLLAQLKDNVERTKTEHDAARLALREALVAFRPAPKGRPAKTVGTPAKKRVRKPKQTTIPGTEE